MEFVLTRCRLSKQPTEVGKGMPAGNMALYAGVPPPRLRITSSASFVTFAVASGTQTLINHQLTRLTSTREIGVAHPRCLYDDTKLLLRIPSKQGLSLEDTCQVTFADANTARVAVSLLAPSCIVNSKSTAGAPNSGSMGATLAPLPLRSSIESAPVGNPKLPTHSPLPGPITQPDPSLGTESNGEDSPETQGFIETQPSVDAVSTQAHPHQQPVSSSDSSVPITEETNSVSPPGKKRRREDAKAERPDPAMPTGSSDSRPKDSEINLIDLDDNKEESSSSLRHGFPAMNPHEGKPWAALDQLARPRQHVDMAEVSMVERPNRYITAGVYGMSGIELEATIDEIVTEVGFQQLCGRVSEVLDGRRGVQTVYGYDLDEGYCDRYIDEHESW